MSNNPQDGLRVVKKILVSPETADQNFNVAFRQPQIELRLDTSRWAGTLYRELNNVSALSEAQHDSNTGEDVSVYELDLGSKSGSIRFYSDDVIDNHTVNFTVTLQEGTI